MEAVKRGGDRQALHERLRLHSHAAAARVKQEGADNDLLDRIAEDKLFPLSRTELHRYANPALYTGRSASQVREFLQDVVEPILSRYDGQESPEEPVL